MKGSVAGESRAVVSLGSRKSQKLCFPRAAPRFGPVTPWVWKLGGASTATGKWEREEVLSPSPFHLAPRPQVSPWQGHASSPFSPSQDHLKECFGRPSAEARDTDVLVQEADSRYGTWGDQRHSGDR